MMNLKEFLNNGHELRLRIFFDKGMNPMTTNRTGYKNLKNAHFLNYKFNIYKSLERQHIHLGDPYEGNVKVDIYHFNRRNIDIDNYQKVLFDSMICKHKDSHNILNNNVILLKDDSQITEMHCYNFIDASYDIPYIEIRMIRDKHNPRIVDVYDDPIVKPSYIKTYIDTHLGLAKQKCKQYNTKEDDTD